VGSPPAPTPPAPPPQPAAGTFILGRVVKDAILAQNNQQFEAVEIDRATKLPREDGTRVSVNFYTSPTFFSQNSYLTGDFSTQTKFPYGGNDFPVGYSNEGFFTLGRMITAYTYANGISKATALVRRAGDFEIKDDHKFIIDTTSAEWRGTELDPNAFVQLQIASYSPSNTVFKLCLHQSFGDVRRLACTLHNKDTGVRRGVQVIDDSRNIGQIEYLPLVQ
jgi:hypothetical protein